MVHRRILSLFFFVIYGAFTVVIFFPWTFVIAWVTFSIYQVGYWVAHGEFSLLGARRRIRRFYDDDYWYGRSPASRWWWAPFSLFEKTSDWANSYSKRKIKRDQEEFQRRDQEEKEKKRIAMEIAPYLKQLNEEFPGLKTIR